MFVSKCRALCLSLALALLPATASAAQEPPSEKLNFRGVPKDFKLGFKDGNGMMEFVPEGQTVHNWKQMITLNIIPGNRLDLVQARKFISDGWMSACKDGSVINIRDGQENGYPFALWQMACEKNPQTGKPEYTWVKMMQGQEGLYTLQYAFRYAPDKQELTRAVSYLRDALDVCDTRPKEAKKHPCRK
ncbi:MAG: hypothetical protein Q3966_04765 [Neisseria sp.]|nr:hypothetical protein [Neisseria sp.]